MGIPVLILGESGSGKSASLRNFAVDDIGVLNVASKPLPFRAKLKTVNHADYKTIFKALSNPTLKAYAIDDSQFLMSFEFFDRAKETGFQKFVDIGQKFEQLISFIINGVPDDVIVYLLHHTEADQNGKLKAKTIGKMLDEKLTIEGLFSIVLLARSEKGRYWFQTQSEGYSTAKSPMGMFEPEIENDLKMVDTTIRDYYELGV